MKIFVLFDSESSCSYHRLLLPYSQLSNSDSVIFFNSKQVLSMELLADVDFVIYSRIPPYSLDLLKKWREIYGFKLIVDLDDYWELPITHFLYKDWNNNKVPQAILEGIKAADYITTTSTVLREQIFRINKNVEVFPNGFNFESGQFTKKRIGPSEDVNIVYCGGQTHYRDLKIISPTINKLKNTNLNFIIAGYNEEEDIWKSMFNLFTTPKVWMKRGLPLDEYMNHYDVADFTVAPLEENLFNSCKSNLKVVEAGCKEIPIVCSDTLPYSMEKVYGVFLCKNNKQWLSTIKELYNNENLRKESGKALGDFVRKNYNLIEINKKRLELLNSIK